MSSVCANPYRDLLALTHRIIHDEGERIKGGQHPPIDAEEGRRLACIKREVGRRCADALRLARKTGFALDDVERRVNDAAQIANEAIDWPRHARRIYGDWPNGGRPAVCVYLTKLLYRLEGGVAARLEALALQLDGDAVETGDQADAVKDAPQRAEGGQATDAYAPLREFTRAQLKGQERAVIEALCASGGELPIADLAVKDGVDWSEPEAQFKAARRRLMPKLQKQGWTLNSVNKSATLRALKRR